MPLIIFKKKRIVEILASLFDVDLYREQTVLSVHGGELTNPLLDASQNKFSSTFYNSSASVSTLSPYNNSPNGSILFGANSGVTTDYNAGKIEEGPFCIEGWIRPSTFGVIASSMYWQTGHNAGYQLHCNSSGAISLYASDGAWRSAPLLVFTSSNTLVANQWNHFALVRGTDNVLRSYINGISSSNSVHYPASLNLSSNSIFSPSLYIGYAIGDGAFYGGFTGNLTDFRVTTGNPVYTSNFVVPASPLAAGTNTQFLLNLPKGLIYNNNHTFIDSSSNNVSVTRYGDVSQGSFSPFADTGGSAYFDGSGDYLTAPGSDLFSFGTDDFTIETFVNLDSLPTHAPIFDNRANGSAPGLALFILTNGKLGGWGNNAGIGSSGGSGAVPVGKWSHIAVSRQSGVFRFFINGVLDQTVTAPYSVVSSTVIIGKHVDSSTLYFKGSMSDYRVTKGVALYTSNFTVPTSPLTSDTNTSLLLKFESAGIVDSTRNNILETISNAQLVQNGKFGSAISLNGASCVRAMHKNNYNFGSSDFTIEFWVKPNVAINAGHQGLCLLSKRNSISQHAPLFIGYFGINNTFGFAMSSNGTAWDITSNLKPWGTTLNPGEWTHLALVRSGTSITAFTNGVATQRITSSASLVSNTSYLTIGKDLDAVTGLNGMIDDLRITVGKARYQSNFVPMLSEFKDVKPTNFDPYWDKVALRMTMDGSFDDKTGKTVTVNNGGVIDNSIFKFGSGSFKSSVALHSIISIPDHPSFNFAANDFTAECFVYPTAVNTGGIFSKRTLTEGVYSPLLVQLKPVSGQLFLEIFVSFNGSSWVGPVTSSQPLLINQWNHFALVRFGSTLSAYINGSLVATISVGSTALMSNSHPFIIGGSAASGTTWINYVGFDGYIDDVRITNGMARYTSNFVPPTAALPVSDAVVTDQDPYWNETVLSLSPLNTSVANYKTGALTLGTSTTITSGKFGNALSFNGTNASICSVPASDNFNFGTGDFTIEAWIQWDGTYSSTGRVIYATGGVGSLDQFGIFFINNQSALNYGNVYFPANLPINTWIHVAAVRNSGVITLFVNGTSIGSGAQASAIGSSSAILYVGGRQGTTHPWMGKIEDLRITKGKARYTTNFTVPALPNPTTGPTF